MIALLVLHFALSFLISICCIPLLFIRYGHASSSNTASLQPGPETSTTDNDGTTTSSKSAESSKVTKTESTKNEPVKSKQASLQKHKFTLPTGLNNAICLLLSNPFLWLVILGTCSKLEFQLDKFRNLIQYFRLELVVEELTNLQNQFTKIGLQQVLLGPVETLYGIVSCFDRLNNWIWLVVVLSWVPVWFTCVLFSLIDVSCSDYFWLN
ncbi:unnamed protein product [Ambrosiozyma monospora]|uniref:Unnamed protein product n=1 Tax=Ambrosiozyma monospora TaxID=43982 RepID=A0ACB5TAF4_AMBMO|nr:unnamed protein product [Ambrosiozyma monospora]